jgi:MYXO-CTERM domain-containing protein
MQSRISRTATACWAAAALLAVAPAWANDLVLNGGFETGDFTAWTTRYTSLYTGVDNLTSHSGTYAAFLGEPSAPSGTISQTLATTAGETYDVSFWLQNEMDVSGMATPNSFVFRWNGVDILTLTDVVAFAYTKFEYSLEATGASTALQFAFTQAPAYWDLDGVSVIPEPSSWALAGLAVGLAAVQRRRRPA